MFTSEVRADFRKISESLFIKDSEEERALFAHESPEWSLPVEDLLKPFVPVLDALYPYFCRRNFLRKTRLYALIYLHRVLRWRKELVYLFPGSSNRLQMFKKKFRQHFRQLLSIVEYTYRHRDHDLLASWIFLIYDDVYYLADLDVVKQDAASHLRQLLEYIFIHLRGQFLSHRTSNGPKHSSGKKRKRDEDDEILELLYNLPNPTQTFILRSRCLIKLLPEGYQEWAGDCSDAAESDLSLYPVYPLGNQLHPSLGGDSACLCSLASHCLPVSYFETFEGGISHYYLRHILHNELDVNLEQYHEVSRCFSIIMFEKDQDHQRLYLTILATYYRHAVSIMIRILLYEVVVLLTDKPNLQRLLGGEQEFKRPLHSMNVFFLQFIPFFTMRMVNDFLKANQNIKGRWALPLCSGESFDDWCDVVEYVELFHLVFARYLNEQYSEMETSSQQVSGERV